MEKNYFKFADDYYLEYEERFYFISIAKGGSNVYPQSMF